LLVIAGKAVQLSYLKWDNVIRALNIKAE